MCYRIREDLKTLLHDRRMTVAELGRQAGVSRHHLSGLLNGYGNPRRETAERIAAALDLPLAVAFPDFGEDGR